MAGCLCCQHQALQSVFIFPSFLSLLGLLEKEDGHSAARDGRAVESDVQFCPIVLA